MNPPWIRKYLYATLPVLLPLVCWQITEPLLELNGCTIEFKAMGPCHVFASGIDIGTAFWLLRYGGELLTYVGVEVSIVALVYVFLSQAEVGIASLKRWIGRKKD